MPAVYLVDVEGDGLTPSTAYKFPSPLSDPGQQWTLLMIDTVRPNKNAMKGLIVHPSTTLASSKIRKWAEAATGPELLALAQSQAPSNQERNFVRTYCNTADLVEPPFTSWLSMVQGIVDQVNPGVNVADVLAAA